ncbi:MAG TPA: DUF2809 domain-containing protein [Polyangiaceae bacterium]|nr:DUF2809 domain-containing protein [Polyangiaceae bacterium]
MKHGRERLQTLGWIGLVIVLGGVSRLPAMPEFSHLYLGDVLWGSLFYLITRFLLPTLSARSAWLMATLAAELVEFGELSQAPTLVSIRETRLGGLLLGHSFSWSDVFCVALGSSLAFALQKPRSRSARLASP